MSIIDLQDPWPETAVLALEVTPKGPYATFRRPWSMDHAPASPSQFGGLLVSGPPSPGLRFTAAVVRMSSARWSHRDPWGPVYLRGFDRDGLLQWSARFTRAEPHDLHTGFDSMVATFNLYAPFTFTLMEAP